MRDQRRSIRHPAWVLGVAAIAAVAVLAAQPGAQGQTPRKATPSSAPRLDASRALAFAEAAARGLNYLPGEVVVRFRKGVGVEGRARALATLARTPSVADYGSDVVVVKDPVETDAHVLAAALSAEPEVEFAEPNYIYKPPVDRTVYEKPAGVPTARPSGLRPAFQPNDPNFTSLQWNLSQGVLDMPRAWDIQNGGDPNIIVAVVDTGVTSTTESRTFPLFTGAVIQNVVMPFAPSPDLALSRIVSPVDFAFLNGGPVFDMDGHGTHVSSTVAETTNNALNLAGVAFNVRIMPVKVCVGVWEVQIALSSQGIPGFVDPDSGGCSNADLAAGILFAASNGADVINISLGGGGQSLNVRNALINAVNAGSFISISMGNDGDGDNERQFPAAEAATIDGAVSVAAVGRNLGRAFYSSFGDYCEIAAPGGDSTQGGQLGEVWQVTLRQTDVSLFANPFIIIPRFDRYQETPFQGTSMAAPHVSGLAALVLSQNRNIDPGDLEALLKGTARDLGAVGRDDFFGFGLIRPAVALRGFGIGR